MKRARFLLLASTAIAVVSDTMLAPFQPRLFAESFGVHDERHVGAYIAMTCFAVIAAFPIWARVARRIPTLKLLVVTQLAAGSLSIGCYFAPSLMSFWLLAMAMVGFKASYLLVYPYLLSLEAKESHERTIGILTVLLHLGAIAGASLGGAVLELASPRHAFLVMAGGDLLQMAACLVLLRDGLHRTGNEDASATDDMPAPGVVTPRTLIARLSVVMFLFYFCTFLPRPFFATYWASVSPGARDVVTGFVYAIPAFVALAVLGIDARRAASRTPNLVVAIVVGIPGLLLQTIPTPATIVLGRMLFGYSLFRAMVGLDLALFQVSHPTAYASDFATINFFQQLGALVAAYASGALVATFGERAVFAVSAAGIALTALLQARLSIPRPSSLSLDEATSP